MTTQSTLLVAAACLIVFLAVLLVWQRRRYQRLRQLAEASLGPAPLVRMEENRQGPLTGRSTRVTILFLDIRGFTRLSENKPLEQVGSFLSAFFSALTPHIEANGGIISSFLGDGLMAIFGAFGDSDHAACAVRSAVSILGTIKEKRSDWDRLVFQDLEVGIGLHTGSAFVGTIGSPQRYDFTAVGDTVNAAARLEQACKQLNYPLLMSRDTFESVPPAERAVLIPADLRIDFLGAMYARGRVDFPMIYGITSVSAPPPEGTG